MTLDALCLEVPDILEEDTPILAGLNQFLAEARLQPQDGALQQVLGRLFRLNRSAVTLLERQRALQSFSEEYRHYATAYEQGALPPMLFLRLCSELAAGFKRLLLQILQGRQPSRPHLAWCLYMAQHFIAQTLMRHYQHYQEPPGSLWRDSHLLFWIGEHQECLDEPVAAAFRPVPASTLRGLYQQVLLLALSNPFHLTEGECTLLFGALAPLAGLAHLLPWDQEDESDGATIDLTEAQPYVPQDRLDNIIAGPYLRRLELGPLLIALHEPAPLQSSDEHELLERVRQNWLGRQQRRHPRTEYEGSCSMVVGLPAIHAQLLAQRPASLDAQMLDSSAGGARLLCHADQGAQLPVGQLTLLLNSGTPTLALVRWRHTNQEGLHLGLRYLKGLPRPVWLRRAPNSQTHPGVLQSTPAPGNGWHHGLWLPKDQFVGGEHLWLQLASVHNQAILPLPEPNLSTAMVARYPLKMA